MILKFFQWPVRLLWLLSGTFEWISKKVKYCLIFSLRPFFFKFLTELLNNVHSRIWFTDVRSPHPSSLLSSSASGIQLRKPQGVIVTAVAAGYEHPLNDKKLARLNVSTCGFPTRTVVSVKPQSHPQAVSDKRNICLLSTGLKINNLVRKDEGRARRQRQSSYIIESDCIYLNLSIQWCRVWLKERLWCPLLIL